jgi:acyl carrier protein
LGQDLSAGVLLFMETVRMETGEIYAQLTDLFRELFANDEIVLKPETSAKDIEGWDSFNHLSVIVAVETRFGLKMKTQELDKLNQIADLVTMIKEKHHDI